MPAKAIRVHSQLRFYPLADSVTLADYTPWAQGTLYHIYARKWSIQPFNQNGFVENPLQVYLSSVIWGIQSINKTGSPSLWKDKTSIAKINVKDCKSKVQFHLIKLFLYIHVSDWNHYKWNSSNTFWALTMYRT